jgi:hypothetical protein
VGELNGDNRRVPAVLVAGAASVVASAAFRGVAVSSGWFHLDDLTLLREARELPWGESLLTPYHNQLMPGGRVLTWLVASADGLSWWPAATLLVALHTLAGAAALWMLVSAFGARWAVLAPLNLYLWSAVTLPAFLWWAAGVNQLPLQVAFFLAAGAWIRYLRGRRQRCLVVTVLAVALGLLFYVKALLVLGVLLYLLLAYFTEGSLRERLRAAVTGYRHAWGAAAVLAGGYVTYYLLEVPQPFAAPEPGLAGRIADTMVGTALASGLSGGPWRWYAEGSPAAYADPPPWAQHLAWVLLAAVVTYAALRRTGTLRAWGLLAGYIAVLWALLLTSRAPSFGATSGLEYRYLTDAVCVFVLCLALAYLPLEGAVGSSRPRTQPLLTWRAPDWVATVLVTGVCLSGAASALLYVDIWSEENAAEAYLENLGAQLDARGATDLADQVVPEDVMAALASPDNRTSRLAPLTSDAVRFPDASAHLGVVASDGTVRQALIRLGLTSAPGPVEGCGWQVQGDGLSVPLTGDAFAWEWWLRISYVASADSPISVSAASETVHTVVSQGVNSLYVRLDGTFAEVRIDGLDPGTTLCVDTIEVGQPVPGGLLP